jgi:RNA polymerase sigma factor (sigma-70 family)
MTSTTRAGLRALLESGYAALRERLKRRLGSDDLAEEALQDTWLRLARGGEVVGTIRSPSSYLYQIALNAAADRRKAEEPRLTPAEIATVLHMADQALDPGQVIEARSELGELERALRELPSRRRAIFIMARVEEVTHEEIGRRLGISARMVEKELVRALDHCSRSLGRKVIRRFGPRARELS